MQFRLGQFTHVNAEDCRADGHHKLVASVFLSDIAEIQEV